MQIFSLCSVVGINTPEKSSSIEGIEGLKRQPHSPKKQEAEQGENDQPLRSAYSGPNRPLIPIESGHLFRGKPAGDSGAK